jgi:class 3 adenylate cyclase
MILRLIHTLLSFVNRLTGLRLFGAQLNTAPPPPSTRSIGKAKIITVLFAEITNFPSYLHEKKANDLMDRWHITVRMIANDFNVCEIGNMDKTFACVTNLFYEQSDHAAVMAKFGICVVKASELTRIDPEDFKVGMLKVRIGIHSGPCMKIHNPGFALFGDSMNMAFQMMRLSQTGRIQCSADSAYLIMVQDSSIILHDRGMVHVRQRGLQRTFWIEKMNVLLSKGIYAKENTKFMCKSSTTVQNEWFRSSPHDKHERRCSTNPEQYE